ncbi:IclR family transcriptional regulator [soil metagenome]
MATLNRSLERGIAVLECFRPGISTLSHGDISERTGLPKPTLTRLLRTLVSHGYLQHDTQQRNYRPGLPLLSLAWTFTLGSALCEATAPVIERVARETQTIIGFGTVHQTDIVYLVACNGDPQRPDRHVGVGMRAPLLTTSVGRAYLAGLPLPERNAALSMLRATSRWQRDLRGELNVAFERHRRDGMCLVQRNEGRQVAAGIALAVRGGPLHALGMGYRLPAGADPEVVPPRVLEGLAELKATVLRFNESPVHAGV